MPACVNPKCRNHHEVEYNFCPVCGADCRSPGFRGVPVNGCDHEYRKLDMFCYKCGNNPDLNATNAVVYDQGLKKQAMGFLIGGGFVIAAAILAHWIISGFYGPSQVLVDQREAGKSLRDPIAKNRPENPYTGFIVLAGMGLMGYGGYLLNQAKIDGQSV